MEQCGYMVCPKPRPISPWGQAEFSNYGARDELLDIIHSMGEKTTNQVASPPPFFYGSPPSRVSNPLIEDSRFVSNGASPLSPCVTLEIPQSSSGRQAREKFSNKPVAVRIEGFNCMNRDRRSVSIVA